ncbi:MAG: hypothetical protein M1829_002621 [Trizodia sp. TS-e1964]|nr:MAG: hypothetical protein M1829_002621 [Trizodia sp. TS-e1964]
MDSQGQASGPPAGRRLHIAHRRSPSELTPLMMEQLAIQQQIELLQQQQQQIANTHQQYVNLGMIQPHQHLSPASAAFTPMQGQLQNISPQNNAYQFPQQMQQSQMGAPMGAPTQPASHRRNQSELPNINMGPPPAPSSGASGSAFSENSQGNTGGQNRDGNGRGRGGPPGAGHHRRHSLLLPEAKKAAELAQQKRTTSGFQFPIPGALGATPGSSNRSGSPLSAEEKPSQGLGIQQQAPNTSALAPQQGLTARSGNRGAAHGRSLSMAGGMAGRGATQGRGNADFRFPPPMATTDAGSTITQTGSQDFQRRGSGHARSSSRNFDGNWRQQNGSNGQNQGQVQESQINQFNQNQNPNMNNFQTGHRARGSIQSVGSASAFPFNVQQQLVQLPQGQMLLQQTPLFQGQPLNQMQLSHLQALSAAQMNGTIAGLQNSQHAPQPQISLQQQQQQQRKTLFTPYLPQANLPALLSDGQLVSGILRVNKKNRSDAYVSTQDGLLDADIFICGSKDRNRALEGDLVAVELLDVDEVWGQKREKEEKKKRKDTTDTRSSSGNNDRSGKLDSSAANGDDNRSTAAEGGLKRRGSLKQRPTQKKNDDVEVEGQTLLLVEEEDVNDEQKPLYAGHIVAVIERVPGQMFSGTLGLLRPSSQATKEKQEAERQAREGPGGRHQSERQQDKPKIVWFKPTDKRVPLIAIPTEQAPRDFVEHHQKYANKIFVACIKRWPITSLHPFGTLVEELGEMGDLKVETDALLRDNNFGSDEFSDAVIRSVGFEDWAISKEDEASRRDFRGEKTFTIDPNGTKELDDAIHVKRDPDGKLEIGIHIADVAHFIKANSLVDREAKKRGTGVYLMNRDVSLLPPKLSTDICSLSPGEVRLTVSIVFKVEPQSGRVLEDQTWIGKAIIKSSGMLSYKEVDAIISGEGALDLSETSATIDDIKILYDIAQKFREARYGSTSDHIFPLRLLHQLDDENVPVEHNIFDSSPAHQLIEELTHKANSFVAWKIAHGFPETAFLRRQSAPNPRRLQTFADRMIRLGYEIDTTSSESLQNSLFKVKDSDLRKGMETLLVKAMHRAKYFVTGKTPVQLYPHYALNLPLYTHFTNPSRRYADIIVHRQLEAILSDGTIEFNEDADSLTKTAEACNTKKDSAKNAQEQSVHIESCRIMDKRRLELAENGKELISEGIVICVYESAFDVLIPEYGFEKRVHCDQLPLKKAEFDKSKRILELYWEKGVTSSSYIPEDERPKVGASLRAANAATAAREAAAADKASKEREEEQRRQMETGTMSTDDVDALFDDDEDASSEITELTAGVSLNPSAGYDHPAQTTSHSPTRNTATTDRQPRHAHSSSKLSAESTAESKLTDKEKYLHMFTLREQNGDYIQDVTEMTRVPVILKTDLTKSPP